MYLFRFLSSSVKKTVWVMAGEMLMECLSAGRAISLPSSERGNRAISSKDSRSVLKNSNAI